MFGFIAEGFQLLLVQVRDTTHLPVCVRSVWDVRVGHGEPFDSAHCFCGFYFSSLCIMVKVQ